MTMLNERERRQLAEIEHALAARYPDLPQIMAQTRRLRTRRLLTMGLAAIIIAAAMRAWPVCIVLGVIVIVEVALSWHRRLERC